MGRIVVKILDTGDLGRGRVVEGSRTFVSANESEIAGVDKTQ